MIAAIATLPRITRFLGTSDAGEGGGAVCPHCGSGGRYVHSFECEDGTTRGAMSGCIQLFSIHPIASADMALKAREKDLRQRFGQTATLNSWDTRIRESIDAFYAGTLDEHSALTHIRWATQAKANYRRSRRR